jgi:hypothetical protein
METGNGTVTVTERVENGRRIVTATVTTEEGMGLCEMLERERAIPALAEAVERAVRAALAERVRLGETFLKAGTAAVRERTKRDGGKSPERNGRRSAPAEEAN